MTAFLAGAISGAVMGLTFQAYWMVVLTARPPGFLNRSEEGTAVGSMVLAGGLAAVTLWILAGGVMGIVFDAIYAGPDRITPVPAPGYLVAVLLFATAALMPAMVLLRRWLRHVLITVVLFAGLFGFLLPNLVIAVER